MRPVIIVFAKTPVPGHVKTRLIPPLSPYESALLYQAFVRDTIDMLGALSGIDVELHTDVNTDAWNDLRVPRRLQHEGDLGLKMLKALDAALMRGHSRAAILGSDSPTLPPEHVKSLLASEADVTLGPAEDGGYYGIAASRTHPLMFAEVRWSSPHALEDTERACEAAGLRVARVAGWFDVDSADGLSRLLQSVRIPLHTAEALGSLPVNTLEALPG